jgi:hypothetical protein
MVNAPTKEDYTKTLSLCEDITTKIEELKVLLKSTVNQGVSNKFEIYSNDLINWIEEIEFNITLPEYEQD